MNLISFEGVQRKLGGEDGPCRRTIEKMIERGEFVQPVQVAPRRVMFIEQEIDEWIKARQRKGTV
jgi:predicted DNA-binding transcriptional regulator AlpA